MALNKLSGKTKQFLLTMILIIQTSCSGGGGASGSSPPCAGAAVGEWNNVVSGSGLFNQLLIEDSCKGSSPDCNQLSFTYTRADSNGNTTVNVTQSDATQPTECLSVGTHSCVATLSNNNYRLTITCEGNSYVASFIRAN